ncbi:peptidoglycan DD-metalloendopeptidase family protein [Alkalimonas mucilaginosa]|uniref:Peptidoglycan DD-metalloendopeptidase family protein n=1 Tax=Alkalimonas mucilaginosa TaxID=3057676 RepID=A0ABU7JJM5_9GAMM|nr:peptidoglycan DD-metalloendopeptidase family protein [Alkalimonas sp. MEB004]MEE2025300.1 peptidoglycan DD-metalloendopeptidase family protein [Alkalimonas sp. MEB004]
MSAPTAPVGYRDSLGMLPGLCWLLVVVTLLLLLSGCAKRSAPAPVERLQINSAQSSRGDIRTDTYQVVRGDTLYSIAFRAGQDFRELARRNQIEAPYIIQPGQQLRMTGSAPAVRQSSRPAQATAVVQPAPVVTRPAPVAPSTQRAQTNPTPPAKSVAPRQQTGYVHNTPAQTPKKTEQNTPTGNRLQWQWPVRGSILARFSHQEHGSKGIKIAGNEGQRINAAAAGQVVYAGNALRGYGNLIIIKHNDDYLSAYAHNSRLLVREQQQVSAGQHIADMGSTEASRTQLHFEIRFRGQSVDPLQFLPK